MTLLALACPHCATALDVVSERQVFVCASCERTLSPRLDGRGFLEVPRQLARPAVRPAPGARIVLLPVWAVDVSTEDFGPVGSALPSVVRLPAVGVGRLATLLQFARNLTRAPAQPVAWDAVRVSREPAEVTAEDAFVLAETVVLRHLEHWPGDDALESLEIPLGAARLLDWPCAVRGSEMIDLVAGLSVHRSLVDDVLLTDRTAELTPAIEALEVDPA